MVDETHPHSMQDILPPPARVAKRTLRLNPQATGSSPSAGQAIFIMCYLTYSNNYTIGEIFAYKNYWEEVSEEGGGEAEERPVRVAKKAGQGQCERVPANQPRRATWTSAMPYGGALKRHVRATAIRHHKPPAIHDNTKSRLSPQEELGWYTLLAHGFGTLVDSIA